MTAQPQRRILSGDLPSQERPAPPWRRVERAPTKGASTARLLAQYIIDNAIEPGTTLPPEKTLSERFGIGRGTMNDALRMLETYGLLELRPGRYGGPVVRRPDATDLASSLVLAFYANRSSIIDVMDARAILEPALAGLAAQRITPEELKQLKDNVTRARSPQATADSAVSDSEEFHNVVFEAAGSPVLGLLAASLHRIIASRASPIVITPEWIPRVASAHQKILTALARHDAAKASKLWAEHSREAEDYYRKEFAQVADQPIAWTI